MRAVNEWIAKHDDARIPPRVRARIFLRDDGRCHISGRKIRPGETWELEHVVALSLGGEHRESNLAPALVAPHKIKTKSDRRAKAKNDRVRKRHLGIKKPRTITQWRRFDGSIVRASRERS